MHFRDIKKAVETAAEIDAEIASVGRIPLESLREGLGVEEGAKQVKEKELLSFYDVIEQDANLGLVALHIEIEKRVRELVRKYNIVEQRSLRSILEALARNGILEKSTISGLNDLIAVGNRAAHGAKVEYDVSKWAANEAGKFLHLLDRKIDQ